MSAPGGGPIDEYLDELLLASRGHPRQIRFQLAEAEAHLRDAAAEGVARGLAESAAEAEAVTRFGTARSLAQAETRRQGLNLRSLAAAVLTSGWWLASVAAIAVGASGLASALVLILGGKTFLVGRVPSSQLTAANCARWLANSHQTCQQAAMNDWAAETVGYRGFLGVLGVAALGAWLVWQRRGRGSARVSPLRRGLPPVVVSTIAVTAFGGAGCWLSAQTLDTIVVASGRGSGQWLGAAAVSSGMAAIFAVRLVRELRDGEDRLARPA